MSSQQKQLPALPGDVTAAWLGSKLGHQIKDVDLTRIVYGTETKLFITISYSQNDDEIESPTRICIKGCFDPIMIATQPWAILVAQREAQFFTKVVSFLIRIRAILKPWLSQVLVVWLQRSPMHHDHERPQRRECTFRDTKVAWMVEEVMRGVEQLASSHGQYWGAKVEDYPFATDFQDLFYDASMKGLCKDWSATTRDPGRPTIPVELMDGERFHRVNGKYFPTHNPCFQTILHGNTHVANTYLTAEGEPRWLDWSDVHVGSCCHDVSYFICGVLSIEDRRRSEFRILSHYLDALHQHGGPRFEVGDKEVMLEFRRSYIANCIRPICPYGPQPKDSVDILCERTVAAWVDHKLWSLIASQTDPVEVSTG